MEAVTPITEEKSEIHDLLDQAREGTCAIRSAAAMNEARRVSAQETSYMIRRSPIGLTLIIFLFSAVAASAQNRIERFYWTHPSPSEVTGYKVHIGNVAQNYTSVINVGLPATEGGANRHVYDLSIPVGQDIYVAISAFNASGDASPVSNERFRAGSPTSPPPPSASPGAASAISHFVLWDANTDTIIDNDFRSGEQIDLATAPCTSIQIVGNNYLQQSNSPGSVQKALNEELRACTDAPSTHENSAPYAWPTDRGPGRYDCAPSLTAVGTHTLVSVPFDGDNCSGLEGDAVSLQFSIIDSSNSAPPPPPPAEELGAPGAPFLVF